jgi:hypothetical protein
MAPLASANSAPNSPRWPAWPAAGRRQAVGDLVGIDHAGAARGEQVGHGALAAADAAVRPMAKFKRDMGAS